MNNNNLLKIQISFQIKSIPKEIKIKNMSRAILLLILLISQRNCDFIDDKYSDIIECMETSSNICSSITLNTKNLEFCQYKTISVTDKERNYEGCSATFTTYISQSMKNQIESIYIESFGFLKAYLDLEIPKFKEEIKCSSSSITYKIGGFQYSIDDLTKIKSKNHCLYYYYNSLGLYAYQLGNKDTVSKEKCISALTMDRTKNADIYCAFADVAILYSDDTKKEFKTCYFLPSESIKSGKLDPSTENALFTAAYTQLDPTKISKEYEVEMVDSKGRKLKYNSVAGD